MSSSSISSTPAHEAGGEPTGAMRTGRPGVLRTGLVIAAILGVLDIAGGVMQIGGSVGVFPIGVAIAMILLGAATVVLVPFAWRGTRWAGWTIAAMRGASALTGLPAFFVAAVPAGAVIAASVGIVLAVAVAALIAFGLEGRR